MNVDESKSTGRLKGSGWLSSLLGPIIVGIVVLVGQVFFQPLIAKGVKREETILDERYSSCYDAFEILLRTIEHASVVKGEERYQPKPTKEKPTALEINSLYCRLALFSSTGRVANEFAEIMGSDAMKVRDIAEFVLKLREEMGIKGEGVAASDFAFAYPTVKADEPSGRNP